jgi:glutaredoxin
VSCLVDRDFDSDFDTGVSIRDRTMNASRRTKRVVLYSTASCSACRRAKAFLRGRGIAFREMDIDSNPRARKEHQRLGGRGVPLLLIGDERLDGFSEQAFLALYERES